MEVRAPPALTLGTALPGREVEQGLDPGRFFAGEQLRERAGSARPCQSQAGAGCARVLSASSMTWKWKPYRKPSPVGLPGKTKSPGKKK